MSFGSIIFLIFASLFLIFFIALVVLGFYILQTVKDIREIIQTATDVHGMLSRKQYLEALRQPQIYERVLSLITNRFGFIAPLVLWILKKTVLKRFVQK